MFWRPVREWFPRRPGIWAAALILAFLALNAVVDEFHQSFVPGRTPSVWDAAADLLGGTLALGWMLHREKARPPF